MEGSWRKKRGEGFRKLLWPLVQEGHAPRVGCQDLMSSVRPASGGMCHGPRPDTLFLLSSTDPGSPGTPDTPPAGAQASVLDAAQHTQRHPPLSPSPPTAGPGEAAQRPREGAETLRLFQLLLSLPGWSPIPGHCLHPTPPTPGAWFSSVVAGRGPECRLQFLVRTPGLGSGVRSPGWREAGRGGQHSQAAAHGPRALPLTCG